MDDAGDLVAGPDLSQCCQVGHVGPLGEHPLPGLASQVAGQYRLSSGSVSCHHD
jgi:hypothetical protein